VGGGVDELPVANDDHVLMIFTRTRRRAKQS
jgi:hypothetical protein